MGIEQQQRAAVVAAARAWIGTPYHHMADIKGVGVDCAMLLVRVYCDLGLVEPFDPRPYTQDWMMHRNEERYLGFLLERARLVERRALGDVILFKIGRCFAHGGIVSKTDPLDDRPRLPAGRDASSRTRSRAAPSSATSCARRNSRAIGRLRRGEMANSE